MPEAVIEKPPSAGLWSGQSDEEEMGFTYAQLETYLNEGSRDGLAGPGDADRAADADERTQAGARAHAWSELMTTG